MSHTSFHSRETRGKEIGGGGVKSINDKRESNKQGLSSAKRDWKCEEKRQYIVFFLSSQSSMC